MATEREVPFVSWNWQPIATAPKDGTVIYLTWMSNGEPQEIFPCQWGHIQRNALIPGDCGMWVDPGGLYTWSETDPDGAPTHWAPFEPEGAVAP